MKLSEILNENPHGWPQTEEEVRRLLTPGVVKGIRFNANYVINDDLSISFSSDVSINNEFAGSRLPFKIRECDWFRVNGAPFFDSLTGSPDKCRRLFLCKLPMLTTMADAPQNIVHSITLDELPNLVSISDLKIDKLADSFTLAKLPNLVSLIGSPAYVGRFSINDCESLKDWKGCPKHIRGGLGGVGPLGSLGVLICANSIPTLCGINECISEVAGRCTFLGIKTGGIGLLLIKGIDQFRCGPDTGDALTNVFMIIEKYLGRPDDIFECQAELIEAGYGEYAQL